MRQQTWQEVRLGKVETQTSGPPGRALKASLPGQPDVSQRSDRNFHGIYSSHLTTTSGSSRSPVLPQSSPQHCTLAFIGSQSMNSMHVYSKPTTAGVGACSQNWGCSIDSTELPQTQSTHWPGISSTPGRGESSNINIHFLGDPRLRVWKCMVQGRVRTETRVNRTPKSSLVSPNHSCLP